MRCLPILCSSVLVAAVLALAGGCATTSGANRPDTGSQAEPVATSNPRQERAPQAEPDSQIVESPDRAEKPAEQGPKPISPLALAKANEAKQALRSGDLGRARTLADEARREDRRAGDAYWVLAQVEIRQARDPQAEAILKIGLREAPDSGMVLGELSALYVRGGRKRDALALSSAQLRRSRSRSVRLIHAKNLLVNGQAEAAWDLAREVLTEDEQDVQAYSVLARVTAEREQEALTQEIVERGLRINESHPPLLLIRAQQAEADGNMVAAVEDYRKAAEADPNNAEALWRYGLALLRAANYPRALEVLKRGAALLPTSFETRLALAEAYRATEAWDAARNEYAWLKSQRPKSPLVYYNLGLLYLTGLAEIEGMDELKALQNARGAFLKYRELAGARAGRSEALSNYLKDVELRIEREQRRRERAARAQAAEGEAS